MFSCPYISKSTCDNLSSQNLINFNDYYNLSSQCVYYVQLIDSLNQNIFDKIYLCYDVEVFTYTSIPDFLLHLLNSDVLSTFRNPRHCVHQNNVITCVFRREKLSRILKITENSWSSLA